MNISLNSEIKQVIDNFCITDLIKELNLENKRLAIEVNEEIVPRSQFESYIFSEGDMVEIVHAVGGG
ncbi:MAG: sulfur carrier protein ThiS [Thiomargarita sp.]|nr:sulfur carrier protein ThiS [Thiomargarita sp.]